MSISEVQRPLNYFRIAWQSALSAALCLGLPAGLLFWLILFGRVNHSASIARAIALLQVHGLNNIIVFALFSVPWSYWLGRISGYHPWWRIGFATIVGILAGWFSPLSNLDGWFGDQLPVHVLHAMFMSGVIGSVTICVGLACGLILRNAKAALTLALATGAVAVSSVLITIILFDQFGIRVGTGNFAMSKVTVASLLASAVMGGMVLGLGFSWFVARQYIKCF